MQLDSTGKPVVVAVEETAADTVEQHIHRLRALSKALLFAWQAELVSPAAFILNEIGDVYSKLLRAMVAHATSRMAGD